MNFKENATKKSCENWVKYPFENNHPLKDERFYNFIYHLCEYEDKIDDENIFLELSNIEGCNRSEEEFKEAFQKYIVIQNFYEFLKKKTKE